MGKARPFLFGFDHEQMRGVIGGFGHHVGL
jgi:hypothetical protein